MESNRADNISSEVESTDQDDGLEQQKPIRLPEPDTNNITVLTKELPNDPILPWHRYDSPWLGGESSESELSVAEDKSSAGQNEAVEPDAETDSIDSDVQDPHLHEGETHEKQD
jgi:hypothetical protein